MASPENYQTPINQLGLSPRTSNALVRAQITSVGQVLDLSDEQLVGIRNFNDKCLDELYIKLAEKGVARHPKASGDDHTDQDQEDF